MAQAEQVLLLNYVLLCLLQGFTTELLEYQ